MKNFLIFLLLALLPGISFAQKSVGTVIFNRATYDSPELAYIVNSADATVCLIGFRRGTARELMANVSVPLAIEDDDVPYAVTEIAYKPGTADVTPFENNSNVKTVTIFAPKVKIAESAFAYSSVTSVVFSINGSATSIDDNAFYWSNLTTFTTAGTESGKNIFPEGLKTIKKYAFFRTKLAGAVVLNSELEDIEQYAFADCLNITELVVGNTNIAQWSFDGCNSLKTIYSEVRDKEIEKEWTKRSGLTLYHKGSDETIPANLSSKSTTIYTYKTNDSDDEATITGYKGPRGNASEPISFVGQFYRPGGTKCTVTTFGDGKNAVSTGIQAIALPSTLKKISAKAFNGDKDLIYVAIPEKVESIGESAFEGTSNLTSIILPNSLTSIGASAFAKSRLRSVTLPSGVTAIPDKLFDGASRLYSLTVNGALTSIGATPFTGTNIKNLNLTFNKDHGFSESESTSTLYDFGPVETLHVKDANSIGVFSGGSLKTLVLENCGKIQNDAFKACSGLTTVTLDVTEIGSEAFSGCDKLAAVTMSNSLTKICARAFKGTTALTSVALPSSLTTVEEGAFEGTGLTSATLPSGVTKIPADLFNGATNLSCVTINGELTSIGKTPFTGTLVKKLNLFFNSEYGFDNAGPVLGF